MLSVNASPWVAAAAAVAVAAASVVRCKYPKENTTAYFFLLFREKILATHTDHNRCVVNVNKL